MTILSTVCTKLLSTNAHLGRRVAAHHFKVYICGSRNGIAILDSDKTLICLRNALHFIGSLIRKKGRSFFLKTNQIFLYEIMEEMASCINDSQWKIGAFLTNSYANPKKFRSRKKKINFGLNQQPDCVVILNPDRKSSVILEADRSQIPIASLVDSTIPWESYKRITYPIPANDPIQFVYLFRHSITKTVILERPRIPAMNVGRPRAGARRFTLITGKSAGAHSRSVSSWPHLAELAPVVASYVDLFGEAAGSVPLPQGGAAQAAQAVQETLAPQEWTAPLPEASGSGPSHNPGLGAPIQEAPLQPPLPKDVQRILESASQFRKKISPLLRAIAAQKGSVDFSSESSEDLIEAAFDWEDGPSSNPKALINLFESLKNSRAASKYFKRAERWVKKEKKRRTAPVDSDSDSDSD